MAEAEDDNPFRATPKQDDNPFRSGSSTTTSSGMPRVRDEGPPLADSLMEGAEYLVRGFNKGLVGLGTLPYRGVDWVGEKLTGGDFLPNVEEMSAYKPFLQQPEPETDVGRYAEAIGEATGSSAIPSAGILSNAQRMAAIAPTNAVKSAVQQLGTQVSARPGAAVAADLVASAGAGAGQQAAEDSGFGPTGQMIAGLAGGMAPFAVAGPLGAMYHARAQARAGSSPHGKVASSLPGGTGGVDDLTEGLSTGFTAADRHINTRVLQTLGEEMVRHNGNRQAAYAATLARLEREGNNGLGIAASTARDQLRRVVQAQQGSELMLGEYPSVAQGNLNTRNRQPDVMLEHLDAAAGMPNREVAARERRMYNPGRIEDTGTHWMMDTIANSGSGPSTQVVRRSIEDRIAGLHDQAMQRIRSWAPPGANLDDMEAALEAAAQAGRAAYRNAYNGPINYGLMHPLLGRVVNRHLNRLAGFSGEQADELRKAINNLYMERPAGIFARGELPQLEDQVAQARWLVREARRQGEPADVVVALSREADRAAEALRLARRDATPGTQSYLLPTLEQLQNQRQALRGQIEKLGRPDMEVVLRPLYRDLTRVMERASPQWAQANRQWADMNFNVIARELGENLAEKAGPRYREQMQQFQRLNPQAQDFVRGEFVQKLLDKIENVGVNDDIAKLFKTRHVRNMIRTILGDDVAVDMLRLVRDNQVAARSKKMTEGSPTQPRLARQEELNSDIGLLDKASEVPTSPSGLVKLLRDYTVGIFKEKRNKGIADIITTPVRDTAGVAQHLERMRQARNRIDRHRNRPPRQTGAGGVSGSFIDNAYGPED